MCVCVCVYICVCVCVCVREKEGGRGRYNVVDIADDVAYIAPADNANDTISNANYIGIVAAHMMLMLMMVLLLMILMLLFHMPIKSATAHEALNVWAAYLRPCFVHLVIGAVSC